MMLRWPQRDTGNKNSRDSASAPSERSALAILLAWLPPLSLLALFSSRTRRVAVWSLFAWLHLLTALIFWFLVAGFLGSRPPTQDRLVDLIFFWFFLWVIVAATGVLLVPVWFLTRRGRPQAVQLVAARCLVVEDQNTALEELRREWDRLGVSYCEVGPALVALWPLIERREERVSIEGAVAVVPGCAEAAGLGCVALRSVQRGSRLVALLWHHRAQNFFGALAELLGAQVSTVTSIPLTKEVEEALKEAATSLASMEQFPDRAAALRLIVVAAVTTLLATLTTYQLETESGALAGVLGLLGGLYALVILATGWWMYERERLRRAFRLGRNVRWSWRDGWQSLRPLVVLAVTLALFWVAGLTLLLEQLRSQGSDLTVSSLTVFVLAGVLSSVLVGAFYGISQGRKAAR